MVDQTGKSWLLSPSSEPAANLAAYIHQREKLPLPVPIDTIVSGVASVVIEDWPYDCDALVVGLLNENRKTIFVKKDSPRRRIRFTLAHEYGHIMMGWHVGEMACKLSDQAFDVEPLGPARTPEDLLTQHRLAEQEAEATRFASYLLLPEYFMRPLIETGDMNKVMYEVNQLDVSAQAVIMRLREMLQPGFVFIYRINGQQKYVTSSGTVIPKQTRRIYGLDLRELAALSEESGSVSVSEREVYWFRLARYENFVPTIDPRTTTEILRTAIAAVVDDADERVKVFASINGVAGGSLSKERAVTPEQALSILRHKFADYHHHEVVKQPDFDVYLRRKTEEWARKRPC